MSLFDKIFRPQKVVADRYFHTLTSYEPVFNRWRGEIYESELVRAAIDAIARHISKLQVKINGAAQPKMQTILKKKPNPFQTWSQFLYRCATILEMQNTLFIVPIIDIDNDVSGLWACLPEKCKILESKNGRQYLEYEFANRQKAAVELNRCGIMTKMQYKDDFFGSSNAALTPLLDLLTIERQGIEEAVKSASSFRFIARSTNWKDPEDLAQEQKNFNVRNMRSDQNGFLLFPNIYDSIQQVQSSSYKVNSDELALIQKNVDYYFGVNEDIITNKASGSALDAFFDGKIEPWAIQMQEVLTGMLFSDLEIGHGAKVVLKANRLQYMSTGDKINFIANLSDRGFITINEGRELLNYDPLPSEIGDRIPIRGEFKYVGEDITDTPQIEEVDNDGNQADTGIPNDSDANGDAIQST